jgi:hypothetical protein
MLGLIAEMNGASGYDLVLAPARLDHRSAIAFILRIRTPLSTASYAGRCLRPENRSTLKVSPHRRGAENGDAEEPCWSPAAPASRLVDQIELLRYGYAVTPEGPTAPATKRQRIPSWR